MHKNRVPLANCIASGTLFIRWESGACPYFPSLLVEIGGILEQLDDIDALRAHILAGTALNAGRSASIAGLPGVLTLRKFAIFGHLFQVQQTQSFRNLHARGAVFHAIAAVGAGYKPYALQSVNRIAQRFFFGSVKGPVRLPFAHVFLNLL